MLIGGGEAEEDRQRRRSQPLQNTMSAPNRIELQTILSPVSRQNGQKEKKINETTEKKKIQQNCKYFPVHSNAQIKCRSAQWTERKMQ